MKSLSPGFGTGISGAGTEVADIMEKQKKDEKSITPEQIKWLSEAQIQLSNLGNDVVDKKKEIILFAAEKCLLEDNDSTFDQKHLDDDSIPLSRWWAAARDIVSFLLVGDTKVEATPFTTQ